MNRESMKKLMDLIDDTDFKNTMVRVEETIDRVKRAKDERQNPYRERPRAEDILSGLKESVKKKAFCASGGVALIFTGGGAKGSFQAGAAKALDEIMADNKEKKGSSGIIGVSAAAGTSVGAFNGTMYAGGGGALCCKYWGELDESRIGSREAFFDFSDDNDRYLEGMIRKSGILSAINPDNLLTLVTAFDTGKGYPKDFVLNDMTDEEKLRCIMASAAFPVALREQKIGGVNYIDGGIPVIGSNMSAAPLYYLGFRRFIVLHCSSREESSEWADLHSLGIDLNKEQYYNGSVFVHLYASRDLGGILTGTMNFNRDYISSCIDLGYRDMLRRREDLQVLNERVDRLDEIHVVDGERYRSFKQVLESRA